MADEKSQPPDKTPVPRPAAAASGAEMSREERIAAAKARAEAIKAQRGAAALPAAGATPAAGSAFKPLVASKNPGGAPPTAPRNPKVQAFGTLTQAVELRCDAGEEQNFLKILGGLGLYKNPLRGVWQVDYRYYAEAVRRLHAAGYQVEGKDYLGRPLERWVAEARGWTKLG